MTEKWQPFERCPLNTRVLLMADKIRLGERVSYGEGWAACDGFGWIRPSPTHWMQLPSEPR